MKIAYKIPLLMILIVVLSVGVNAFAVSMPYMKDKTVTLYPGESSDLELVLQNMVGDQDERAVVTIKGGDEVAKIVDKENVYEVPKGTKNTKVHIRIDIPAETPLGTEYDVRFSADLVTGGQGGMVQVSSGISDGFKVIVGSVIEKPLNKEKALNSMWFVIGGILLGVIILAFLVFYRKK